MISSTHEASGGLSYLIDLINLDFSVCKNLADWIKNNVKFGKDSKNKVLLWFGNKSYIEVSDILIENWKIGDLLFVLDRKSINNNISFEIKGRNLSVNFFGVEENIFSHGARGEILGRIDCCEERGMKVLKDLLGKKGLRDVVSLGNNGILIFGAKLDLQDNIQLGKFFDVWDGEKEKNLGKIMNLFEEEKIGILERQNGDIYIDKWKVPEDLWKKERFLGIMDKLINKDQILDFANFGECGQYSNAKKTLDFRGG